MSNERIVDELYGDTMDEDEKKKEIERLNAMDGYEIAEPIAASFDDIGNY